MAERAREAADWLGSVGGTVTQEPSAGGVRVTIEVEGQRVVFDATNGVEVHAGLIAGVAKLRSSAEA